MKKNPKMRSLMTFGYSLLAGALCILLILYGDAVREGVVSGLEACAQVIIPSLFLFMAVSGFIAQSRAGEVLSRPFSFLTRRLLKLPECMGAAVILSCIGGYPVGARTIASLLERGKIDRKTAERAICFCCNAGPSFVVTAVGARMLGSVRAGAVLLLAHLLSSLLLGVLYGIREPVPRRSSSGQPALPPAEAFITGVNNATSGILTICAFVVFFSAFGQLLKVSGITSAAAGWAARLFHSPMITQEAVSSVIIGLLEVTTGCLGASALPSPLPQLIIPFLLSFAGFSIIFQVRSILAPYQLRFTAFLWFRLLHGVLTVILAFPFLPSMGPSVGVYGVLDTPVGYHTPNTPLITILLLIIFAFLLQRLTLPQGHPKAKRKG